MMGGGELSGLDLVFVSYQIKMYSPIHQSAINFREMWI